MKFHVFMLPTIGEPHELTRGMAGQSDELYQMETLELFATKVMPRLS